MIAKEVAAPRTGGSFRGLVSYLTNSHGKTERLGLVRLTNCISSDIASAVLEVESAQARNQRARHSTYHVILSFPVGEEPRADVLASIERRACEALGFAHHQRLSVVHHDTDHLHVHVAINRIDPKTHRVHWPSYSKLVLDRLCVELEQEHGLEPVRHRARERAAQLEAADKLRESLRGSCADRFQNVRTWVELHDIAAMHGINVQLRGNGIALVRQDGVSIRASSVARDLSKVKLERRLGAFEASVHLPRTTDGEHCAPSPRRAPDSERFGGVETLIGWIQRECAESLRRARSWSEVHETAAAHGLDVRLRNNGLTLVTRDGLAAKASSVARDLSKAALERRLGSFEGAAKPLQVARAEYQPRPMVRDEHTSRLYERYRQEREGAFAARGRAIEQLRQQRGQQEDRLERISQRRWAAVRVLAKGRMAWAIWSAYARRADRHERERVRARYRASVRAAVARHPRTGWLDWLRSINVADPQLAQRRIELLNQSQERADGQRRAGESRDRAGSTRGTGRLSASAGGGSGLRKPYRGRPRSGSATQTVADLRGVSALNVVRLGRSPEVLLPGDARRDVEQRRAEQPDRGVRRDPAQHRVGDSALRHGGRSRR